MFLRVSEFMQEFVLITHYIQYKNIFVNKKNQINVRLKIPMKLNVCVILKEI